MDGAWIAMEPAMQNKGGRVVIIRWLEWRSTWLYP